MLNTLLPAHCTLFTLFAQRLHYVLQCNGIENALFESSAPFPKQKLKIS